MTFSNERSEQGNINSWISDVSQVKASIKPTRKKIMITKE